MIIEKVTFPIKLNHFGAKSSNGEMDFLFSKSWLVHLKWIEIDTR